MSDGVRVEADTSRLEADTQRMAAGVKRAVNPAAADTAQTIVNRPIKLIPIRTGALRDTVATSPLPDGAAVHYGGTLSYADAIAKRTGCLETATTGADKLFRDAMQRVAAQEVRKV